MESYNLENAEHYFKLNMGHYTTLTVEYIYNNIYTKDKKNKEGEELLDEIYRVSGGLSKNPFVFLAIHFKKLKSI